MFVVPQGVGTLRCKSPLCGSRQGRNPGRSRRGPGRGRRTNPPKQVRSASGWIPVNRLLPPEKGKAREYSWNIAPYVGQTLCIALIDNDNRPGCHIFCTGIQLVPQDSMWMSFSPFPVTW